MFLEGRSPPKNQSLQPSAVKSCYNRAWFADHEKAAAVSRVDACIRPAVPSDAAELAALARRVFAATYGTAIPASTLRAYFHEHITPTRFRAQIAAGSLLVAVADACRAGYARIHATPPLACVGDDRAVELAQLYVDQAYQGAAWACSCSRRGCWATIWCCGEPVV